MGLSERHSKALIALILFVTVFVLSFSVMQVEAASGNSEANEAQMREIHDFRKIPGITEEQIAAVEAILKEHDTFTYGMRKSSECFIGLDGNPAGFGELVSYRLSDLFGVEFETVVVDFQELPNMVRFGEVDFSGDFVVTGADLSTVYQTQTMVERAVKMARLNDATPFEYIAKERPVRLAFLNNGQSRILVNQREGEIEFEYEDIAVANRDEALALLRSGEIDAFVSDSSQVEGVTILDDITVSTFSPLTYKQLGITTSYEEYQPILDVIDLYLSQGGLAEMNDLYTQGYTEFCHHVFKTNLSEEEAAWYEEHITNGTPIKIAVSYSNYPVNFYNEKEGEYAGIVIDILAQITDITGLHFHIKNQPDTSWSDILAMLENGDVDMVAELLHTAERETKFLFSNPYAEDHYVLISRSDTAAISLNQVLYANIGLITDSAYEAMYNEWFPSNGNTTQYPDLYAAFDGLEAGEVDYVMANEKGLLIISNYMERSGFKTNLQFDYSADSQFGFNKDQAILVGIINKALFLIDTDGITSDWKHMTFDYEKQMAKKQTVYMIGVCALLAALIFVLLLLMRHRRMHENQLESLVAQRTEQLEEQTRATEAASNAKSHFLANMSHEMRTPLNAVIGLSELTLTQDYEEEEVRGNVEKIYNSGVTLLGLVNDILDLSKIESGNFELVPVDYDIPSLINDTITLNIIRIGSKPIEFKLDITGDLPARLFGDELRIKQVFNNLLSNAFKYTKEGEVLWSVRCERDPERPETMWLVSDVRDTGIGIKPEDLGKVFGEYSQVDTKANRKIEGTGLGLAITRSMVEMMGGSLTVESVYGEGSVFHMRVQQGWVTGETIGAAVVENLRSFRYADRKRDRNASFVRAFIPYARVLVVDDVATNLDVARGLLKPYGMQVDTVMSGRAAIEQIQKADVKYNAVFMDHMMPEMDGIEATRIIKNEIGTDYARGLPIIALTANALVGNEEMFKNKGFQDFLSKPIDIIKLDDIINRWVRDKKLEKELAAAGEKVGTATADSPAAAAPAESLFEGLHLRGVDIDSAVMQFGGDEEMYLDVLRSFERNTPGLADRASEVTKEALADYAIIVHGMKSASRNIGAASLGNKAEALEKAAKSGDFAFVSENNAAFVERVRELIWELAGLIEKIDATHTKEVKKCPDAAVLEKLRDAALAFDIDEADAAMEALEQYAYEEGNALVEWLREQLDMAGFANIAQRLAKEIGN
ncbi:MAG: transporter substrate-binding domain-containing protein [Clostridiales Family XIII bacterium]|jgi:signal transduction histidine kinase/FixJ family two-component response regulator/HPt (histidine-containing phosphotransfer) domain-containing protein|nr:transporter substrate-binding domain-containing protein [Clostridiales Family XIII bacterium]